MKIPISPVVKRFEKPDAYFGGRDRCVLVVIGEHANEANLRKYAFPLEEYIVEQLNYRIVGDLLVLGDNDGVEYSPSLGLTIPERCNIDFKREPDGILVHSYAEYEAWTNGEELPDNSGRDSGWYGNVAQIASSGGCITVVSSGEFLVSTNYGATEHARKGFVLLSINAGAFRLLVPKALTHSIADIQTGKHAVLTRGFDKRYVRNMYELLFDDDSDSPFALWISPDQMDRHISITEAASRERRLHVYLANADKEDAAWELVCSFDIFFREAAYLPYLEPWLPK